MGRKAREGSVNLYYLKNQDNKKNKSVSKANTKKVSSPKKTTTNTNKKKSSNDRFNFDDEIVIGVTKKQEIKKKPENKPKKRNVNNKKSKSSKTKKVQAKSKTKKEKTKKNFKIFKYVFLACSILAAIICFMLSPVFNITEIKVEGNNRVLDEEIISLSQIIIGENIYKLNKNNVVNNIKQNAYIESVDIKRKFPTILEITIKERQATYMLEYVNSYAYINNQGYMLEITDQKIERPVIVGVSTSSDNIKTGNRLVEEDLVKLESVLKIMEAATSNEIERLITKIDISDKSNFVLYMEAEGKTVRLGDINDMSTKMLHIKTILEKEVGIEGEIVVNTVSEDGKSRFIQKIN